MAAIKRHSNNMVELLLAAGADVHKYAAFYAEDGDCSDDLVEEVRVAHHGKCFMSPIQYAACYDDVSIATVLCAAGADINQPAASDCDYTALRIAIRRESFAILDFLLSMNVDLRQDDKYEAALVMAVSRGSTDIVRLLLSRGESPNQLIIDDFDEATLLTRACDLRDADMVRCLLQAGADPSRGSALVLSISQQSGETITRLLLDHGADVNQRNDYFGTPLQSAILTENFQLARELIQMGADIHAPPLKSRMGRTALQAAAEVGSVDMLYELLRSGADVNASAGPDRGVTALQAAAIRGYMHIAQILLQHGARIDAPACPVNGRTAIDGAAQFGRIDMVKLLLDNYHGPINKRELIESAYRAAKRGTQWYVMALLKSMNGEGGIGNPMAGGVPPYV